MSSGPDKGEGYFLRGSECLKAGKFPQGRTITGRMLPVTSASMIVCNHLMRAFAPSTLTLCTPDRQRHWVARLNCETASW